MAKAMALLDDNAVINMLWCSENEPETETLKCPGERPVGIGDTYTDGKWYRGEVEILTPLETAMLENELLRTENANMKEALELLGVSADE